MFTNWSKKSQIRFIIEFLGNYKKVTTISKTEHTCILMCSVDEKLIKVLIKNLRYYRYKKLRKNVFIFYNFGELI